MIPRLIQAIKQAGLSIPHDIAIVGFNDDPVATIIEPALTTIAYPAFEMGQAATQQFLQLKLKENKNNFVQNIELQTKLIVRSSSKRY